MPESIPSDLYMSTEKLIDFNMQLWLSFAGYKHVKSDIEIVAVDFGVRICGVGGCRTATNANQCNGQNIFHQDA